ncbi:MAG: hypothetical protein HN576_03615 [Bacteriovoracaceae bacterium]|nr:hypothetical protein [Bacteriovoracaceae bacterium]
MKLEADARTNRDTLKKLNRELSNKIAQRNKEIKKSEEMSNLRSQQVKVNERNRENEIRNNIQKDILIANKKKQEKLQTYKDQLERDKTKLENERVQVSERNDSQMRNNLNEYKQSYRERYTNAHEKAQNVYNETQTVLNQMSADSRYEIQENNRLSKKQSDSIVQRNENLLHRQKEEYLTKLQGTQLENARNLAKEKIQFEADMRRIYALQSGEASAKEDGHAKAIADKEEFYSRTIMQKEKGFKDKLTKLIASQNSALENIRNKFQVEVNKVENAMTKKKLNVQTKGLDEFYQVRSLDPKIIDHGKFYSLQIALPAHEQEGATFNASNRKLRINFVRNYSAEIEDDSGNINKSKRNELFTKVIHTDDILDPKGVRTKYNKKAGILEVSIKKA